MQTGGRFVIRFAREIVWIIKGNGLSSCFIDSAVIFYPSIIGDVLQRTLTVTAITLFKEAGPSRIGTFQTIQVGPAFCFFP